jgi:hypothetical protein
VQAARWKQEGEKMTHFTVPSSEVQRTNEANAAESQRGWGEKRDERTHTSGVGLPPQHPLACGEIRGDVHAINHLQRREVADAVAGALAWVVGVTVIIVVRYSLTRQQRYELHETRVMRTRLGYDSYQR